MALGHFIAIIAVCGLGSIASAQTTQNATDRPTWRVGLIGVGATSPFVGEDALSFGVIPAISFDHGRFSSRLGRVSFAFVQTETSEFSALVRTRSSGSPLDRDLSFEAGLEYAHEFGPSRTRIATTFTQDITQEHDGRELSLRATQPITRLSFPAFFYTGVNIRSDGLSEYLYGVRPNEATINRPAYAPGPTITPFVGISGFIPLTRRLGLTANLSAEFLPDDIQNSPIVENDDMTQVGGALGLVYRF